MKSSILEQGGARLPVWLGECAERHRERPALVQVGGGPAVSFTALEHRSRYLASALLRLGLASGDAIAIWLPNRPEWMVVHFAAARLGLFTVPINTWCRESEVAHFLRLGRCHAIVLDSDFRGIDFIGIVASAVAAIRAAGECQLRWVVDISSSADGGPEIPGVGRVLLADFEDLQGSGDVSVPDENPTMIAFSTSGTTSAPKLAVHREAALLSHATAVARRARMTDDDVVLAALPPCGAYGYTLLMAALAAGARSLLIEEFDIDRVVESIPVERVTMLALTEPIMRKLLDHPRANRAAFASLRLVFSAGGTLEDLVVRAERDFGFRLTNVYGSSEILALAAFWDFDHSVLDRSRAGGRLVSDGMQVRAADAVGQPLRPGVPGQLQFRGPIVTQGYLANDEANQSAFSDDGWFSSGDLGSVLDAGAGAFLYMVRMNDALRVKGFLVSPGEIEAMLQSHTAVAAAQVVGVPDGLGEELPAAFVMLRPGMLATEVELLAHCRARMASYKAPAILRVVDAFPMTRSANGDKVMKSRLREMAIGGSVI